VSTITPTTVIEDGETILVFRFRQGTEVEGLMDTIAEAHPHIFDDYEDGPWPHDYMDDEGNFWTVQVCPCCQGRFAQCQGSPKRWTERTGEVRVSRRLLRHAETEESAPL
jgi:hypothetical protein